MSSIRTPRAESRPVCADALKDGWRAGVEANDFGAQAFQ
jgi:hypothetical protein